MENLQMKGKVRCKLCSRELTQSGGSTSSLKHHLQEMHPDILDIGSKKSPQPKLGTIGIGLVLSDLATILGAEK